MSSSSAATPTPKEVDITDNIMSVPPPPPPPPSQPSTPPTPSSSNPYNYNNITPYVRSVPMNSDNANDTDRSVISAGSSLLDVTIATDASASTAHYSHNQYNQRSLSSRQQQQQQQQQPPSIIRSPSIIKNSTNGRSGGNLSGLVVDAGGNNNTDNGSVDNGRSRIDDDTTPMGTPNQTNRRSNSIISNWTQDLIENVYDTSVPFVPDLNNGNTNTNHCNDNTTAAMISLRETIGLGLRDVRDTNRRDFDRGKFFSRVGRGGFVFLERLL